MTPQEVADDIGDANVVTALPADAILERQRVPLQPLAIGARVDPWKMAELRGMPVMYWKPIVVWGTMVISGAEQVAVGRYLGRDYLLGYAVSSPEPGPSPE